MRVAGRLTSTFVSISDFLIRTRQEAELLESGMVLVVEAASVEAASRRLDFEQMSWKRRPAAWILKRAETALLQQLTFLPDQEI